MYISNYTLNMISLYKYTCTQAGYNPLMLAVANNINMDYKDVFCNLVDRTGVNSTAEKVL